MSLLAASNLSKRFGGLLAVDRMELRVEPGEIVGLIGPNGSGKSTTLSLIMGVARPDMGSIRFEEEEICGWPTHRIARRGIGLLFQHSHPLRRQSVLENIALALLPDSLCTMRLSAELERRARRLGERVGLGAVLAQRPDSLPFAHVRRMELAKAIAGDPRLLLLDEPFAGLTAAEARELSGVIRALRGEGRAVILVDHNVKGVRALVDRMVAIHVGRKIAEGSPDEVIADPQVREVFLGTGVLAESAQPTVPAPARSRAPLLEVKGLSVYYGKGRALDNVDLEVHEGEFVSVVGLNGAGKTTLFNALSGFLPYGGEIRWQGAPLNDAKPSAIARAGIIHCPETRELFGDMSVRENLDLAAYHTPASKAAERERWLLRLFPILARRERQAARTLSGGEQQMLAIARALMPHPKLLILDEPTLGLAPVVLEMLSEAMAALRRESGLTILLGEQNLTFALRHSQRLYLLENGRIAWHGEPGRFAEQAGARYL